MNAKGKGQARGRASEKSHPILVAVIGAIAVVVAALIPIFFTVILPKIEANKLKPFYSGTATGYTNSNLKLTQVTEDGNGNVNLVVNFTVYDTGRQADYECSGQATNDKITLNCSQVDASQYTLDINGSIFSDGHMEGSLSATNKFIPNYHHLYSWNVS